MISSDLLLTHYDPELPIVIAADASAYGIGAVESHVFQDGSEKAIMHASRSLTAAEQRYSQIKKEALVLVFSVIRFHKLILWLPFHAPHRPQAITLNLQIGIGHSCTFCQPSPTMGPHSLGA